MKQDRPTITLFFITVAAFTVFASMNYLTNDDWFVAGIMLSMWAMVISFFVAVISAWRAEHPEPIEAEIVE